MTRKVRHPHQALEASEMVVGELYAFIRAYENGVDYAAHYTMGGVFDDTRAAAVRLGHDLDSAGEPEIEMLIAGVGAGAIVTVHMDGWRDGGDETDPTLMYWRECMGRGLGWDMMWSYLGPERERADSAHTLVVPSQRWADDPRLHVANWSNPDGVVERAPIAAESPAEWERRMRARAHAAMAETLGF